VAFLFLNIFALLSGVAWESPLSIKKVGSELPTRFNTLWGSVIDVMENISQPPLL